MSDETMLLAVAAGVYTSDKTATVKGIACRFGIIPHWRLYNYLVKNGIKRHSQGRNQHKLHKNGYTDADIVRLYNNEGTLQSVGDIVGISRQRVSQILLKCGFTFRYPHSRPLNIERVLFYWAQEGESFRTLATRFGTGRTCIGDRIVNYLEAMRELRSRDE